ncbi:MAG: ARPP-1 family domain-containing protein [Actinomycetota bacterium]
MDSQQLASLVPSHLDTAAYQFGLPQMSGQLTVVPVFGWDRRDRFTSPLSGLKLSRVHGYGNLELHNASQEGVAIVPLHIGYIQDQAQNHALCRSAFIAAGQKLMFQDACCVQAAQGGYLEGREQWFFILPLQLRLKALELRGLKNYNKLWEEIGRLNASLGLPRIGHLEQVISRKRAFLTQYQSRLELLPQQTGGLFFLQNQLVGVEIAPSAAYFQEVWMPLVCFCYGVGAMSVEKSIQECEKPVVPLVASSLQELRQKLHQSRLKLQQQLSGCLAKIPTQNFRIHEEERFLSLSLKTAIGSDFAGQFIEEAGEVVYLSMFAKPDSLSH